MITNILYRNKGNFGDITTIAGLAVETRFVGWGAGIVDLDNDSHSDLSIVTENIYPEVAAKIPQYPLATPRVIFRNLGNGRFEELMETAGTWRCGSALQPRLRFRRLRQRWRLSTSLS